MKQSKLIKEMYTTGSNKSEARELAVFAEELEAIKLSKLSSKSKKQIAEEIGINKVILVPRYVMASASGFAVIVLFFVAQSSLPGSWLYPVKRGTEQVRAAVQPNFDDNLIEIRKDEVEQLKQAAAPIEKVEKAEEELHKTEVKVENKRRERQHNSDSSNGIESQDDNTTRDGRRFRFRSDDNSGTNNYQDWQR